MGKKVEEKVMVLTPEELASRWRIHYKTVMARIKDGTYPSINRGLMGRTVRIPMKWVLEQESQESQAQEA